MKRKVLIAGLLIGIAPAAVSAAPLDVPEASISDIENALKARKLTCAQLIDDYLARIAAYDKNGPTLNAVITINPEARNIARQLDADFDKNGKLSGPLHCIPVAVKDNYNTLDMPTSGGNVLFKNVKPLTESTVIRRLRDAGAIILLKTNMHEFASGGTTVSSLGGQTRNPYDLTRTPGGSSGGTGAAIAAGFAVIGLGSDTVNSIRSPASANSLVGFRTTKGVVSRAGVMPNSSTQDVVGPLTRSVADAAAVLDVIAGYDAADPATARAVGKIPSSFKAYLDANGMRGARIGIVKSLMGTDDAHQDVNRAMADAVAQLKKGGATVVAIDDPSLDADQLGRDLDVQKYEFKTLFNGYLGSLGSRAPVASLHDLIVSGKYLPSLAKSLSTADSFEAPSEEKDYLERLVKIDKLRDRLLYDMAQQHVDVLIYPLQKRLVVPISEPDQKDRNGILASLTGFPAITVPIGFSPPTTTAPIGIPIGMDMLGRPYDDARLVRIAYAFERARHARRSPVSVPALN